MQSRCCWPPERPEPGLSRRSLTSFQRLAPLQRLLDERVGVRLRDALVVELHAREHVLLDRHRRERVRPLEHHADLAAHEHGVDAGTVQVVAVEQHLALDAGAGDDLVHAVEGAQERRLAAAGRADEGRDAAGLDREGDALDGEEVAVVDVEVVDFDALGQGSGSFGSGRGQRPVLGEKTLATMRATRLRTMTIRMSVSAAAQARSV